jgi:putative peptidoglycan lipid II flippase
VIPFSVLLMVLRKEVVFLLFQRGRFDAAATQLTSGILIYLLIGAFAFAAQTVVVRGFYAAQNTFLPALFGTFAVLLSLPLYYYGMQLMGANGIALAISLSATLQVLILFMLWNRRSCNREGISVYAAFARIALISLPMGLVLEKFKSILLGGVSSTTVSGSLTIVIATGGVFWVILLALGHLLKIQEISDGLQRIRAKIWGRAGR